MLPFATVSRVPTSFTLLTVSLPDVWLSNTMTNTFLQGSSITPLRLPTAASSCACLSGLQHASEQNKAESG